MITGSVNASNEAIIPPIVLDGHARQHVLQAVIDTGFTGSLTLPMSLIEAFGLLWQGRADAILGDGTLHEFDVFSATVLWDGELRTVETGAADVDQLAGMGLLHGYRVEIDGRDGGEVRIDALP